MAEALNQYYQIIPVINIIIIQIWISVVIVQLCDFHHFDAVDEFGGRSAQTVDRIASPIGRFQIGFVALVAMVAERFAQDEFAAL